MSTLFTPVSTTLFARIAVERAVDRYPDGLTYAVPTDLMMLTEGERVMVPLGKGDTQTAGYVVELLAESDLDPEKLKPIYSRDAASARLPTQLMALARWISAYYCAPIGLTLAAMLPAAVKKNIGSKAKSLIDLAPSITIDDQPKVKLSPGQIAVINVLAALPASDRPIEIHALAERAGWRTVQSIRKLVDAGLLALSHRSIIHAEWEPFAVDAREPESLTPQQQVVMTDLAPIISENRFSAHLLFGVTSSGKTEVYIQLLHRVVASGKMAVMLVPEIALTPQTGGRLLGRFPNHRVAVLHSGLTAAQRHHQWSLVAKGEADIVLGARSAVFAPVPDDRLGLIIVDEEHDGSYKQDQTPRYHGRDVAIRRAQLANCPVILGSATPSLESWHNAVERESYTLHRMTERIPGMKLPKVIVVDFVKERRERPSTDRHVHLIGPTLERAIGDTLDRNGQILLLLNRRGYANYIACPSQACGWVMQCEHCDVTTVYHVNRSLPAGGYVQCHHCLSEQKLPATCPDCGKKIVTFGLGTQRVEEELTRKFSTLVPDKTMLRVDSDTMRTGRDYHDALHRFGTGEVKLLVGTQMIAKGLDYPGVRLVGVINADTALNLPDFRATERTFQLVNQVAGRCGRSADIGIAVVQTFSPDSPAIQLAAAHDFVSFAELEMGQRKHAELPPYSRMARIVVRDEDHVMANGLARDLMEKLRELVERTKSEAAETVAVNSARKIESHQTANAGVIRLRGPAPCPISRVADFHRVQIEIFAPSAAALHQFLTVARRAGLLTGASSAITVDVDPIALL